MHFLIEKNYYRNMEFQEHLKSYLSDQEINSLVSSLQGESKHAVLLNLSKMRDETFLSLFPHVQKHPIVPHAYLYDKNEYQLGKSIYHDLGCFYLQEPSAMVPAYLLGAEEHDLILDLCAAPGGKTIQTSFKMNDTGLIVSNDLSRNRCNAIIDNAERLGLGNIVVTNNDFAKIYKKYLNTFSRIILDAPCSGSGMFRKESKMEEDWSYNKVIKFAETQKELILIAYAMLKEGGTMCYSTCSFSKEEDENVIEYLLDNTDAQIENIESPLFYVSKDKPLGVHLFPHIFPGEGHYICLIKKPGILSKSQPKEEKMEKYNLPFRYVFKFGDYLFGSNYKCKTDGLNIVRLGVKVGELIKDEIKFDYQYAHYVKEMRKYELNDEQLKFYFKGETIPACLDKGYYLLTYQNINVDIAKNDGRIFKNHLPKYLRKVI